MHKEPVILMAFTFHQKVVSLIRQIPKGNVATYGQVAALAGNNRAARQVARSLHSSAEKEGLPWHRVINSRGRISLPPGGGFELQREMLIAEGVIFTPDGSVDLGRFGWNPRPRRVWFI
jgi:methylated-DNA-protein-cysteine methyltransferase related protein